MQHWCAMMMKQGSTTRCSAEHQASLKERIAELFQPSQVLFLAVALWAGLESSRYLGRCSLFDALNHAFAVLAILRLLLQKYQRQDEAQEEKEEEEKQNGAALEKEKKSAAPGKDQGTHHEKQQKKKVLGSEQECCCICLEGLDHCCTRRGPHGVRRLDCGHEFHRGCVGEWLRTRAVCPLCKDGEDRAKAKAAAPSRSRLQRLENNIGDRDTQIRLRTAALYMLTHHPFQGEKQDTVSEDVMIQAPSFAPSLGSNEWSSSFTPDSSARLPLLPIPNPRPQDGPEAVPSC